MIAVRTQFTVAQLAGRDLAPLRESIERAIPLSAGQHNRTIVATAEPRIGDLEELAAQAGFDPADYVRHWRHQLGSLGSGNHFIEVSRDEDGAIWLFLHSGSRGVGNMIAQHHIREARRLAEQWWIPLPDREAGPRGHRSTVPAPARASSAALQLHLQQQIVLRAGIPTTIGVVGEDPEVTIRGDDHITQASVITDQMGGRGTEVVERHLDQTFVDHCWTGSMNPS
jgi:hypothetical protein